MLQAKLANIHKNVKEKATTNDDSFMDDEVGEEIKKLKDENSELKARCEYLKGDLEA